MFDDTRFYFGLAENANRYGKPSCSDSAMFLSISALDFEDDLLAAMDKADDFLID